jgi:hypothetical protein
MRAVALAAALAASLAPGTSAHRSRAPISQAPATGLTLAILVDVTASLHSCPGTVAGVRPMPVVSGGRNLPLSMPSLPIPRAVYPFALNGLRPDDRVLVGAVARRLVLQGPVEATARELRGHWQSLFELPPADWMGPSPIWDALAATIEALPPSSGRRAIVLVTDGQASGNRLGHRDVADLAARAGVSLNFVIEEPLRPPSLAPMSSFGIDPGRWLTAAAERSGGVAVLDRPMPSPRETTCVVYDPARHVRLILNRLRAGSV